MEHVSENVKSLLGYSADEFISGKILYEKIIFPDDVKRVSEEVAFFSKGRLSDFVHEPYRLVTKNNKTIWVDDRTNIKRDNNGNITHYQGIILDITDRIKMEQKLSDSEEKYKQMFYESQVALFRTSISDGTLIDANKKYAQRAGYSTIEECKRNFNPGKAWVNPQARTKLKTILLQEGSVKNYEAQVVRADGTVIWISFSAIIFPEKGYIEGSIEDITDRKNAEQALLVSELKFRSIFQNHSAVKLLIDASTGKIIEANKAAEKFYGWTLEELQNMKTQDLNTLPAEQVEMKLQKARLNEERHFEFQHQLADGTIKDVEVYSSNVTIGNKEVLHSIVHDISERKKAEKERREAYDELEDTNTALKVLLNKREKDQEEIEDKILANYQSLIEPLLYRLKKNILNKNQHNLLDILESNLADMISPFSRKLSDPMIQLTPKELQVASFIKQDYSNKEIAETFNCSVRTIDAHRNNIRKKLDIKNKKVNLKTYLMTLQ